MPPEREGVERLPPQSREAELCVLGSMLRDNGVIGDVIQIVRTESFYSDAHQKIYKGITELYDKGHPVDTVVLAEHLKQQQQIEDVGGYDYLGKLWNAAPTAANAEYYARIVRDRAIIRNLIHASTEILRDAYDQAQPADEMLESAERKILEVAQMGMTGQTYTLEQALAEAYDRIDTRHTNEQRAISGLSTGFADLDEITAGLQKSELIILAARPSVGKCLAFDSEILLADGSVATIEEVYRRKQARLLTLGNDWRLGLAEPSAYVDDGLKLVYRVTTRSGKRIETTLSHPFLTIHGWRPLAEVTIGERVAVPRSLPVFGAEPMRECEIKLLAYLIGDGCLTDMTPEFTNGNPRLREEFATAVGEFGGLRVRLDEGGGKRTPTLYVASDWELLAGHRTDFGVRLRAAITASGRSARQFALSIGVSPALVCLWSQGRCAPKPDVFPAACAALGVAENTLAPVGLAAVRKSSKNPLTLWLDALGLWGKGSRDKFIPPEIYRLPREQLALFLNRLFATDGWATVLGGGQTQLGYASVSERLTRQLQHLLLRFGILSNLRRRAVKYRDTRREAWQLDVTDGPSIRAFIAHVGIFGKEAALKRVEDALAAKQYKTNCDVVPVGIWERLNEARGACSWAEIARRMGLGPHAGLHVGRRGVSRPRLAQLAAAVGDADLQALATSDLFWDEVVSIETAGYKQVYDLTVPETHNFVANDVCVHNTAFSLNVVRNIVVQEEVGVFFVSLEQSRIELAERLLCSQARVDSHRLRKGNLNSDDIQKLIDAGGILRNAKLFIDDTPGQGMLRIAANARRLKLRHDIRLVVIDYLQLIEPENRRDPRQEQVAQISRRLKFLARELNIPVMSLAQVNRAAEDRQDHRPRLSDLRESGCLTGDTLVTLADTGRRVPIRELVGRAGFNVWALDEQTWKLVPAAVSNAFSTGSKPVFRLETRLGRVIRATANHRFRSLAGWRRLDELAVGDHLALTGEAIIDRGAPGWKSHRPVKRLGRHAFTSDTTTAVSRSDVLTGCGIYWDAVVRITPEGEEEVYDLTVPGPANFVANDIVVHNSIEQDADTVLMLHRPDRYEPGQHEGIIEIIVAKQRNGPTGEVTLTYLKEFMRYEDFQTGTPFDG